MYSYKLAAIKLVTPSKEHLEKHYEDLADKPFYKGLVTCMSWILRQIYVPNLVTRTLTFDIDMLSGPICAMVWEGREAVKTGRGTWSLLEKLPWALRLTVTVLLGATNPLASAPGTIRGDFAIVNCFQLYDTFTQSG